MIIDFDVLLVQMYKHRPIFCRPEDYEILDSHKLCYFYTKVSLNRYTIRVLSLFPIFLAEARKIVKLNPFVTYHHFKMDTIETVISHVRENCYNYSFARCV